MLKQEIPMPVAIGILVAVLLVVGFFVYRSLFAPPATVKAIPEFQPPPPGVSAPPPPSGQAPPGNPSSAPVAPAPGYGTPR
jgi:hypothetical protein